MALVGQHEGLMACATGAFVDAVDPRYPPDVQRRLNARALELRDAAVALRPKLHEAARAWRAACEGRS